MARILITGSRSWDDGVLIATAIEQCIEDLAPARPVLVSGACPDGADAIAEYVAAEVFGLEVERHPADWQAHGRSAGFRRNAEMVDLGADVCLAFISYCNSPRCDKPGLHPSHGASHTADLAERAGIPTHRFTPRKAS